MKIGCTVLVVYIIHRNKSDPSLQLCHLLGYMTILKKYILKAAVPYFLHLILHVRH